ncbi:MAG: hypothetical protein M1831_005425 [Alyxoria varia]|nr:MAG: hypothetical protein M1831_005425 [Alyxoria varia]
MVLRIFSLAFLLILQTCFSHHIQGHIIPSPNSFTDAATTNTAEPSPRTQSVTATGRRLARRDASETVSNQEIASSNGTETLMDSEPTGPLEPIQKVSLQFDSTEFKLNGAEWILVSSDCNKLDCDAKDMGKSRNLPPLRKRANEDDLRDKDTSEQLLQDEKPKQEDPLAEFRLPSIKQGPKPGLLPLQPPWEDLWRIYAQHSKTAFAYFQARKVTGGKAREVTSGRTGGPGPEIFRLIRSLPELVRSEINNQLLVDLHMLLSPTLLRELVYALKMRDFAFEHNFGRRIRHSLMRTLERNHVQDVQKILRDPNNLIDGAFGNIPREGDIPEFQDQLLPLDLVPEEEWGPQPDFDDLDWKMNWQKQLYDADSKLYKFQARRVAREAEIWSSISRREAESVLEVVAETSHRFDRILRPMAEYIDLETWADSSSLVSFREYLPGHRFVMQALSFAVNDPNTAFHEPWPEDYYIKRRRGTGARDSAGKGKGDDPSSSSRREPITLPVIEKLTV